MQTLTAGTCEGVFNMFTFENKYPRYRFVFAHVFASCFFFVCFGDDSHQRDARHSHHCEDRRDAETAH